MPLSRPTNDAGSEETYVSLDSRGLDVGISPSQTTVHLQPPGSGQLFSNEEFHIWATPVFAGAILLGGSLALRFTRNTHLIRRRRFILGAITVYLSTDFYRVASLQDQCAVIQEGHPLYHLWCCTLGLLMQSNHGKDECGKIRKLGEMLQIDSDDLRVFRSLERDACLSRHREKGLAHYLLVKSCFLLSTRRQRVVLHVAYFGKLKAAGVPMHDRLLAMAHFCMLLNLEKFKISHVIATDWSIRGALALAWVAQNPVVLGVAGVVGVCSLAYQTALFVNELNMLRNVWLFDEPAKLSHAIKEEN